MRLDARIRQDVLAQGVDEPARLLVLRCGLRDDLDDGHAVGGRHRADLGDALRLLHRRHQAVGGLTLHDHLERSVEPGPEALGERVVGLPGGHGGVVVALVHRAEPQRQQRDRERGHQHDGHQGDQTRAAFDGGGPARDETARRLRLRAGRRELAALPTAEHPVAEQSEQRGQQGDGGEHAEHHGQRGADDDTVQEAQVRHQHADERDAHRAAREQHRAAGGVQGGDRGVLRVGAAQDAAPVPGDDEQGVVDADTETDQRGQQGGDLGDGGGVAEQLDGEHPGADTEDRHHERQQHREEGSERREQHDGGRQDADQFGRAGRGLLGARDGLAAQVHLEPVALGGLCRVDDVLDQLQRQRVRLFGERHLRVGDAPVLADLLRALLVVRTLDGADAVHPPDLLERRLDP